MPWKIKFTIVAVLVAGVIWFILSSGGTTSAPTGTGGEWGWTIVPLMLLGIMLILTAGAWKELKDWAPGVVKGVGTLVLLVGFLINYPGFMSGFERDVDNLSDCYGYKDCELDIGDIPVITGGTVTVLRGATETFYVEGFAILKNTAECTWLSYDEELFIRVRTDSIYFTKLIPASGKRELAVVDSLSTSIPKGC